MVAYAAHDAICIKIHWTNLNGSSYFPSLISLRPVKFTYGLLTATFILLQITR